MRNNIMVKSAQCPQLYVSAHAYFPNKRTIYILRVFTFRSELQGLDIISYLSINYLFRSLFWSQYVNVPINIHY